MHVNKHIFRPARIIVSVLAGFFITINGRWDQFAEAIVSPSFYLAAFVSYGICYLLLYLIHLVSVKLDRRVPWDTSFLRRLPLQLFLGLCVPLTLDLFLAGVLIAAQGSTLQSSGFLANDLPFILIFLVLVNGFYLVYYFLRKANEAAYEAARPPITPMEPTGKVLICYRLGRKVTIQTSEGQVYHTYQPLASLLEPNENKHLIQINRSTLISQHVIADFHAGERRDTLQILIKDTYEPLLAQVNPSLYIVTKEYLESFHREFDHKLIEKPTH